jgi:serine protease AprX
LVARSVVGGRERVGDAVRAPKWELSHRAGRGLTNVLRRHRLVAACAAALLAVPALASPAVAGAASPAVSEYVVSYGATTGAGLGDVAPGNRLSALLAAVGGSALTRLGVGSLMTAQLTSAEAAALSDDSGVVVTPDLAITLTSPAGAAPSAPTSAQAVARPPAAVFPEQTGASSLWAAHDTGAGVNVAVLDTGVDPLPEFAGRLVGGVDLSGGGSPFVDGYGHGTFVAGLIAGDGASSGGQYLGEAPGAGLVSVKVAGASGTTDLATVIKGVAWTIEHATSLHIRVLNMSLGFRPFQSTTSNPLDQAVQLAWNDGITVVTSAGNAGPFNGTILSPGDDPSVITVGALDDLGQTNPADDVMTNFSSVGPTDPDGWFKPDLVTSGRSVVSLRAPGSTVDVQNPQARVGSGNFVGSGTSFASAITAGAVALLLSKHPGLTPDQVKASLLGSAAPGPVGNPFVDGHGDLDVAAAAGVAAQLGQASAVTALVPDRSGAGSPVPGTSVSLATTWTGSSWNPANWSGLSPVVGPAASNASAGDAWNGDAWNGDAWNGEAWNAATWAGDAWNGDAWNGDAWNGDAWNGDAWNGDAWNGDAWNGDAWNGDEWD